VCIVITVVLCALIINQNVGILKREQNNTIDENEKKQEQIDDFLEYEDTFSRSIEIDDDSKSAESETLGKGPVKSVDRASRPEVVSYVVKKGDTLWNLAKAYGTDVNTIANTNNIRNPNSLKIGQRLQILTTDGIIHNVCRGESLWAISRKYDTSIGEIVWANELKNPDSLNIGQELIIPNVRQVTSKAVIASAQTGAKGMRFIWPVKGQISSPFGNRKDGFHYGLDIACPIGRTIQAAESGKVDFVGWLQGYGRTVLLKHGNGIKTRYAHTSKILVNKGETVNKGQKIAEIGNSGRSTGPHLHFEIIIDGKPRDPMNYLP